MMEAAAAGAGWAVARLREGGATPRLRLVPGTTLGHRYQLVRPLGRGGFASVWLANDLTVFPGRQVAVKVLLRETRSDVALRRFRREAEILRALEHPSIVRGYDLAHAGDVVFLVMEYVPGESLQRVLQRRAAASRDIPLDTVLSVFAPICRGVAAAHAVNILHRDLKPANIVLNARGVKVLDFGVAKLLEAAEDDATTQGRRLGSYFYMAPEQAAGEPVSVRTDVFALGCVLFELLTLHRAWARTEDDRPLRGFELLAEGRNTPMAVLARISGGARPSARALRPELPAAIDALLRRAMAVDPADRPGSVSELLEGVLDALSASLAPRPPAPARLRQRTATSAATQVAPALPSPAASLAARRLPPLAVALALLAVFLCTTVAFSIQSP